jgi:preprotein translocase subunit YajC
VLISTAFAQTADTAGQAAAAATPAEGLMSFLPMILIFVVLWLLMIRPQMKRAKEHKGMLEALSKGDEVVTNGGIAGKIADIGDSFIQIEIAANTVVPVQKQAIAAVLPKGTLKTL